MYILAGKQRLEETRDNVKEVDKAKASGLAEDAQAQRPRQRLRPL